MSRRSRLALLIVLAGLVSGCASTRERIAGINFANLGIPGVYRSTIQQGNVITQEMVDRLKPGMTQRQVRFILGEPILGNTFRDGRWDYVYTVQVGAQARRQQRLTIWFEGDALARFEGDFVPTAIKEARQQAAGEDDESVDDPDDDTTADDLEPELVPGLPEDMEPAPPPPTTPFPNA